MRIKTRILALLIAISLLSFGAFLLFQHSQEGERLNTQEQARQEQVLRLQRTISGVSRSLFRYLRNYSARGAMTEYLSSRDPAWAEKYLKGRMDLYRIDSVWVLDTTGAVVYGMNRSTDTALVTPPVPADELEGIFSKKDHFSFFARLSGGIYQIQGMPIMPPSDMDRLTKPHGWLLVAKRWGELMLEDLADAGQGRITLTGPSHVSDANLGTEMEVWLPLCDQHGRPVAGLDFHTAIVFNTDVAHERQEIIIFGLSSGLIILLVGLTLHFWVLRPFRLVTTSLAKLDATPLGPLLLNRDEFGQMARGVQAFLRDRQELQQRLAERARLGQELHDDIIQGIYGAGMMLSSVESQLGKDPAAARGLLVEIQHNLNRVIQDLRGHIDQVDPKPLRTTFGEAVAQLIQQLHGPGSITSEINIDEELASALPPLGRRQVLQFTREAISNALRHSQPTRLEVSWQRTRDGSRLVVADDGSGFDQNTVNPSGRGLGNLTERAFALGGRMEIASQSGQGSRICLLLPPP